MYIVEKVLFKKLENKLESILKDDLSKKLSRTNPVALIRQ